MSLLEQDNTKKKQVDKAMFMLEFENDRDSKEYKVQAICNSKVYVKKPEIGHYLPGFYYLDLCKGYFEEENT